MAGVNKIKLVDEQGQVIQLGKLIKSGGAGSVYHIASAKGQVAKLYHDKIDKTLYRRKTSAMLALKPSLPPITDTATPVIQLAWPISQLFNQKKQFVGFVMPELDVSASIELEYILQERQAKANNLPVGLGANTHTHVRVSELCTYRSTYVLHKTIPSLTRTLNSKVFIQRHSILFNFI